MLLPQSLQQILDDNMSNSASLLKRLLHALETELLNPELSPSTFIAYIEYFRTKTEPYTAMRHFCDELILNHNCALRNYPISELNFIKEYEEFLEETPQQIENKFGKAVGNNK